LNIPRSDKPIEEPGTHGICRQVVPGREREYPIFREINPPSAQASMPISRLATWYTWSEPFEDFLRQATVALHQLTAPRLSRVSGHALYGRTFSWSPQRLDNRLRHRFIAFAERLEAIRPGRKIMLFDGLLGGHLDSKALHALFALLRGALVALAGDPRSAMYTPLGEIGKNAGEFPLHADLYIPPLLFNVFDNVAAEGGGASTFLPVTTLRKLIPAVESLPDAQGRVILALFEHETQKDQFEILYDLLHGPHPWVGELEQAMEQRQLSIQFATGQGYLLHDRKWLHGRAPLDSAVPIDRVRRLVFGAARVTAPELA
jgi:hypothetical protein